MAWKEITLTEEEQKSGGGRPFRKFNAIGDTALGFYVRAESITKTFKIEEGPKTMTVYVFFGEITDQHGVKSNREFEITPPFDLERKMDKAQMALSDGGQGLQAGMGHLVKMKFSSTLDTGQQSPMKIIDVAVDTEFKPKSPLPASVVWAKSKEPARQEIADDDIPF